jgi:SAM-dependent methyltransferase
MAHLQQHQFLKIVKQHLPNYFKNVKVVEIGSLDINGSIRGLFETKDYTGVDLSDGRGVDLICEGQLVDLPSGSVDCLVSVECFEHNPFWLETFANMLRMSRPCGLVLMTCASVGRREHGTARSSPESSPFTTAKGWSYYRNLSESDFTSRINLSNWFSDWQFMHSHESYDLFFVGVRRGKEPSTSLAEVKRAVNSRFRVTNSMRTMRRFLKVALLRNLLSSPLLYYFRGKR